MVKKSVVSVNDAKQKIANYCVYQDRCHKEVEEKLNEYNLIDQAKDEIIVFLIQHDFLNEERFAKSFARGKFNNNHWGKIKIKRELKQRNIGETLIKIGLQEIEQSDYLTKLDYLIQKKLPSLSYKNEFEKKMKLKKFLVGKGFEFELIDQSLGTI